MLKEEKERTYYEGERPEMLKFVPDTVKKTIEFGCGDGNFSASIKQTYKTESWGVDMDPTAIENANQVLDKVLLGEAMKVLQDLPNNYFDCVVCNDFLEHIPNPGEFIMALRPFLKDSAVLVCSLPNVRHWKNLKELIFDKDWRYRDAGILDNTHLRFFTKKSMIRLMTDSGLTVEKMHGISPARSLRFIIPNILAFKVHDDMKYLQFAIRARFL